ncbi:tRNA uridine-5-carboxymethylaminomethyl(34) synthesis GTPase MnmE [Xylella fastidiosa subsp. fastidiosa]|jgi:tRNA modification GTPase|uniref:tRNA modification GTPase MnmE n=2 Tax=Xylella fastidiosa TaxID=2371 RepID=MNME_XYLFT|nr:tRNA uridine-5-carboxymethylaminomethyl(34) synthesis GTPase MnmE [Xylella fastidiosa]Q879S5.1 RecName: Full=tRNA modification GTPase MnmE [Xylella fastidiosa Temecula1]ADN62992.1 tRNA modification GTPase TrmE [Xylella fastidiosa subsp. fastidiosa GB514]KAF0570959.1 tRNA modification GTPase TrmE [Xylella fastidiosa subsp. fastidiosa Mus-1]AAO29938.1 thiophene and furan oxidation protein [Xylella fastidiosa Temecula1]ACB93615.1 tRNA modification GTPase TrmE [Xylella fastidiosa M23]KGM19557.
MSQRSTKMGDTIAAIATASGAAGIGIIRISGSQIKTIATGLGMTTLRPRYAHYTRFLDVDDQVIDDGLAIWFPAPHSFTGEDVLELQGHGSPLLLRQLLTRCLDLGARQARPGEFSERAFLNGKLDLIQAEAIADMIGAADLRAARAARRSLDGVFSRRCEALAQQLVRLRIHVEATIDFADESLDTLDRAQIRTSLQTLNVELTQLLRDAEHGKRLCDGLYTVLVGPPNVGKSSLLNALIGSDRAIVTDVPGTTRDTLRESVHFHGLEFVLVDTAGLRGEGDAIEREGMRRTLNELQRADLALVVLDACDPQIGSLALADALTSVPRVLWIHNKLDLLTEPPSVLDTDVIPVSAMTGAGLDTLKTRLRTLLLGETVETIEGEFSARLRHVQALQRTAAHVTDANAQFSYEHLELTAEELRLAYKALGEINGSMSPDELLGRIFSNFCIGK